MAVMKANILTVKVYPKDLKSIPDILPFRDLINGEPLELELDKKEIWRCMHFGDVFDLATGEEVLIDRPAFNAIEEYVEEAAEETPEGGNTETPEEPEGGENSGEEEPKVEDPLVNDALVNGAVITE